MARPAAPVQMRTSNDCISTASGCTSAICRACRTRDALDQPGELHRREGQGRHGDRGHRRGTPRATSARAGRSRRRSASQPGETVRAGRHRGPGRDPAHLDDAAPAAGATSILRIYWDDAGAARRSSARSATSSPAAGAASRSVSSLRGLRQSRQRASTATGRCRSASARGSRSTNIADEDDDAVYYQINYTLTDVPDDAAYFHAQFRRVNPLPYKDVYTILDGVQRARASTSAPTWPGA